jgi:hypothetical protein
MARSRQQIAHAAAEKLRAARPTVAALGALVGWDGFVDEIIAVVDTRQNFEHFEPIRTIDALAGRIAAAAGKSSNLELVVKQVKPGGNGPILAAALAAFGAGVTYLGALGEPKIHPVFAPLAARARRVISIAQPGETAALEFDDGKLMLAKQTSLADVSWQRLIERISPVELVELFEMSALVAMVNWTEVPHTRDIWAHLADEVLPQVRSRRQMLIDLTDPEKRTAEDLCGALELLGRFGAWIDVTLGLNRREAEQVARVLAIAPAADTGAGLERLAAAIRQRVGLACVVIHTHRGASAATERETASLSGPFVHKPKISTGAGDHFNAGFALGRLLSFSLVESLLVGVATSGYYVRTAGSPTLDELADFADDLPEPER